MVQQVHAPYGEVLEFPDDTPDDVIKATVEKYRPKGVLDKETYTGAAKAIGPRARAGITAVAATLAGPDESIIDTFSIPDEDKELMAKDWYGKSLQQIRMERDAGLGNRKSLLDQSRQYRKEAQDALPPNQTLGGKVVSSAIQSVGQMAPALGVGLVAGPAAAAGVMGATSFADTAATGVEKGASTAATGATSAGVAAAEIGTEYLPFRYLLSIAGGSNILTNTLKFIVAEEGTELLATMIQGTVEKIGYEPNKSMEEFRKQMKEDLVLTALSTPLTAGAQAGIAHSLRKLDQVVSGKRMGDIVDEQLEKVREAATRAQAADELADMGLPVNKEKAKAELDRELGKLKGRDLISSLTNSSYQSSEATQTTPLNSDVLTLIQSIDQTLNPEEISDEQVAGAREQVRAFEAAKAATPARVEAVTFLAGINEISAGTDLGEIGESSKVAASARRFLNENDSIPRSERQVLVGPAGTEGMQLQQTQIDSTPGTYVLGVPTVDRPEPYLRALADTIESWRSQYLPGAPIILSNESLPSRAAVGWHTRLTGGAHVIVPAALRGMKDPAKFNTNAQVKTFYNLAHEFGHALVDDRFFEGVSPSVSTQAMRESQAGLVSEETLAQLPQAQADVLREFNAVKSRILDGSMTATEFQQEWMNPAKVHKFSLANEHYVAGSAPATQLVDALIKRSIRTNEALPAEQLAALRNEYLGLHEYLAEQTSRYAYAKEWDQKSALNRDDLFARAFASARATLVQFFKQLKREQIVAPGAKFQEWLDGLTSTPGTPQALGENAEGQLTAKQAKAKKPKKKSEKKAPKPVDHNVATVNPDVGEYRKLVTGLVRNGTIELGDETYKRLMGYLKGGDYSTFIDEIQPMLEKNVKFELDDEIPDVKKVGLGVNAGLLVQQFGANMYSGNIADTVVKELVQNAFDAVKQKGRAELGQATAKEGHRSQSPYDPTENYQPEIDVKLDSKSNTIQVSDNGIGMTPEILLEAFLTYPGSSKVGLPPEESSGGFGLAKVILLFTPKRITVQTVRDGKLTTFQGTPDEIINKQASMTTKPAPDARSGTVVTIELPKEIERPEGMTPVELHEEFFYYKALNKGLLAPGLNLTVNGNPVDADVPVLHEKVEHDFPWGKVEFWYDADKEYSYPDTKVYSSGFFQFTTELDFHGEKFPYYGFMNIRPHVMGKDGAYPFTNNRQGLKEHASDDIKKKFMPEIFKDLYRRRMQKTLETYSRIKALPKDPKGELSEIETEMEAQSKDKIPRMTLKLDTSNALFHNNTNYGAAQDPDARRVIARLGNWAAQQGGKIWKLSYDKMAKSYGQRQVPDKAMYFGIMLTKEQNGGNGYLGVSLAAPYQAFFVNPFGMNKALGQWETPEGISEMIYQTFMHEFAHAWVGDHNANFANALADIQTLMAEANMMVPTRAALIGIIRSELDTFKRIRNEFQKPSTKNLGDVMEGVKQSSDSASGTRSTRGDVSTEGRDGTGGRIPGDSTGSGIHYELDDDGQAIGFGVPHAGSELDSKTLVDAAAEWKKRGFRSKYFKAWFGDWEGDPVASSKVMAAHGQPLPVYHATQAKVQTPRGEEPFLAFDEERVASIGFHFGTVRAANARGYDWHTRFDQSKPPSMQAIEDVIWSEQYPLAQGWLTDSMEPGDEPTPFYIIPAVLNIRNPLDLGDVNPGFWYNPVVAATILRNRGIFDDYDLADIQSEFQGVATNMTGGRQNVDIGSYILPKVMEKGYDGFKYKNSIEGDTSWVAFHPEQIKSILGTKVFSRNPSIHLELDFDEHEADGHASRKFRDKFKPFFQEFGPFRRALRHVTNLQYKTLQLQQLAHINPDLPDLSYMVEKNNEYNRYKGELQAQADRISTIWNGLGKENFSYVNKFLLAEQDDGQLWVDLVRQPSGKFTYVASETFYKKLKEFKIDPDTAEGKELAALILEVKNSLLQHVDEAEQTLALLLARRYAAAPAGTLNASIMVLKNQIHAIRKRPFFPQGRFGNFVVTIEKKREKGPGYEVVHREAFENEADWSKFALEAQKRAKPDERVRPHKLTDTEYVLMSLPSDFLELAASELGLSKDQVEHLLDILQPVKSEKALKSYDLSRLRVKGASTDALRSYANFMWHNSNLLAKLRYRADFNLAIRGIGAALREQQYSSGPKALLQVDRLSRVKRYMERTRDYVMSPPNEAHMSRAFVSLAYLAYNIKTALLNLYGLITTASDLTTRFGLVEGGKILASASYAALRSIQPFDLNAANPVAMKPEWQAGLDRALAEGVLSQSYAYHLAGMANSANLYRLPSRQVLGRASQQAIDLGMWTFRLTELSARRITFLAMLEAELRQGDQGLSDAYTNAVAATNKLQNDYSLGNRVPFMRGIKTQSGNPVVEAAVPLATVFMSFAQHMAFHAYGGYEVGQRRQQIMDNKKPSNPILGYTAKIWIITLLLAGYEGLPGAENLLDLLDALWKKLSGKPLRQELREYVQAIGGDPVWWSRGMGHNVAGFDVSRSLGFGRLVPGTDTLAKTSTDLQRDIGTMVFDLAGPTGGMIEWMLKTAFDNKPLAEGFKRTPGAIGNVITAYSWSQEGVRSPSGAEVTRDLETGELRDLTTFEIFGKALGFNPTVVAQNREIIFEQHDARMYWLSRRSRLLQDHWRATISKDREAVADTRKAINEFNESTPEEYRSRLRITPKEIADSTQTHRRALRLEEMGQSPHKRYRELYKDVSDSFRDP